MSDQDTCQRTGCSKPGPVAVFYRKTELDAYSDVGRFCRPHANSVSAAIRATVGMARLVESHGPVASAQRPQGSRS